MDSEDGKVFVKRLAHFVRTHERALANALQLHRKLRKQPPNGPSDPPVGANPASAPSNASSLSLSRIRPFLSFSSSNVKPAKLSLTPHHLYYLLTKFEDLGVDVGPMTFRLEDIHSTAPPLEYTSFLGSAPKSKGRQLEPDNESLRSVSSTRSVMSTVSSILSNLSLSNSASKLEKQMIQHRDDVRYLYSCFTKLPALRLAPDHRTRLVAGFEMKPFDVAVPLFAFKNVTALEICDLDFRQFHGWDRMALNLRSLTIRRGHLDDPLHLLFDVVVDDARGKRTLSSTSHLPTTPSTPITPWPANSSPRLRNAELSRSLSTPDPSLFDLRRGSLGSPRSSMRLTRGVTVENARVTMSYGQGRGHSPVRPPSSRHGGSHRSRRGMPPNYRRSSGSSGSSSAEATPRHSVSDLSFGPSFTGHWSFLRHLSLMENGLALIDANSFAPVADTLQSLDLSGNLFSEIPDLSLLTHLRALNLSNCMIESLRTLAQTPLPAVTTLNLRSNRLSQLNGIERLPSLERVDLRDNRLHDPIELNRLTGLPNIADVYVAKNPFTRNNHSSTYRVTIFNLFRKAPGYFEDITIDSFGPLATEKKLLVDRVPEAPSKPVIKPPLEDDELAAHSDAEPSADVPRKLEPLERPGTSSHHRRATSDLPATPRRRKTARRRVIELSPGETSSTTPKEPSSLHQSQVPPFTPSASMEPQTPDGTPRQTTAMAQHASSTGARQRPGLAPAFTSPTPNPRIRDPSDDDEMSPVSNHESAEIGAAGAGYQKMENLEQTWMTDTLRREEVPQHNRDQSGHFGQQRLATSTMRQEQSHGIPIGARTLG